MDTSTARDPAAPPPVHPGFREALRFWLRLGFISFGGPTGQIAIMHEELVERRRWIGEERFLHALNYCMFLPGPEAQQLATYIGWLLHGTWGGIAAGALFVLPAAVLLWALAFVYAAFGTIPALAAVFYGLKPAVTAIVAFAVIRIGRRALKTPAMWTLAATAFIAIFFFHAPFPAIILAAGLLGFFGGRWWPEAFPEAGGHGAGKDSVLSDGGGAQGPAPTAGRAVKILAACLALWFAPLFLVGKWLGWDHSLWKEGVFFSKAALVTFGGAYAVLPYVAQQAVERFGWLTPTQMLDGLGLAETTPGPLILVVEFVGFLGGWNHPGNLSPLLAGTLGALVSVWATFVPCFLWIFLGAPYIERLRGRKSLSRTLSAITAAVVGVVLNLAVWFGWHVFLPAPAAPDWYALAAALGAFAGMYLWDWGILSVVGASAALGILYKLALPMILG